MNVDNLKSARKSTGMTQKDVSTALNISPNTYKNYEQGLREPNGDTIVALANLFGVTTDYLLGRPTAQPPTDALERLFTEKSFSALEEELLRKYMELPHEARQAVVRFINDATAKALQRKNGTAPQKLLCPFHSDVCQIFNKGFSHFLTEYCTEMTWTDIYTCSHLIQ